MPSSIPRPELESAITFICEPLKDHIYAVRGTASLVLQSIDMNVDDIDIVCDRETALDCNQIFKDHLVKPVTYSKSPQFKSYFGEFRVDNFKFEVMGDWQIKDQKGIWSKVFTGADSEVNIIKLNSHPIRVTKPEVELQMFALMSRWSAYHKIKKQIS